MTYSDTTHIPQGSDEWLMARCGKVTASKVAEVLAMTKTGPSERRTKYMWQLVSERLTGDFTRTFTNDAMLHGIENEPIAREFYEALNDLSVEQVGLYIHPRFDFAAASPDGLVGDDGLIEIKCLTTVNHLRSIYENQPPKDYLPQVHWQMACTGRKWCDLTLFDPRVPLEMQLHTFRIHRDESEIERLEAGVEAFNNEIEAVITNLRSIKQ
mgnify:FL=1